MLQKYGIQPFKPKYSTYFILYGKSPTSVSWYLTIAGLMFNGPWFWYSYSYSSACRNLSHNTLSGVIGNVFTGLQNLREMYASFFSLLMLFLPLNWTDMNGLFYQVNGSLLLTACHSYLPQQNSVDNLSTIRVLYSD